MKRLLIAAAILIVLIVAAVNFLSENLDAIAESAIEAIGSKALGVDVAIGGVEPLALPRTGPVVLAKTDPPPLDRLLTETD